MMPIMKLVSLFGEQCNVKRATREAYKNILGLWITWAVTNFRPVGELGRADVIRWRDNLITAGKSELTIECYIKVVSLFYKWTAKTGQYANIAEGLYKSRQYRGHRKGYLDFDQVRHLFSVCPRQTQIEKRNFAILNLMVRAGLRCCEVSRLKVKDVTTNESGAIIRVQRKGHNSPDACLGLAAGTIDPICCYLTTRSNPAPDDPLFANHAPRGNGSILIPARIGRIITKELKRASLKDKLITAHSLRHTFAVLSLKLNVDTNDVRLALGHQSLNTTQIYTSAIESERLKINPAVWALDKEFSP